MRRHILLFFLPIIAAAVFLAIFTAYAADSVKTSESHIASFDSQISSATSSAFTLYLGDDLSGITDPVKSVYFTVTGVYTGGSGSLELKIDNDSDTAKTFSLPSVSAPTPFEIVYRDDSGKINPASAGSYSYTLYFTPSGVNIFGLAARLKETHVFVQNACPDGQPTNEKVKSSEFFIGSFPAQISSATSSAFTLYLGDDLSGITDPVKSVYFTVTGVYTGGSGSLELKIDNDSDTAKTFSLPSVSAPTPFEIVYRDDSGKINPASAGSYSYTLYFTPSGVNIFGLAAQGAESHRYKPPGCGGGYQASGDLISRTFDTTATSAGPAYNSILWKGTLPAGTKVKLQLAASDCSNGATNYPTCSTGDWSYVGGSTCGTGDWYEPAADTAIELGCFSNFNNKRYFKYKVRLCSDTDCVSSGSNTPQVDEVVVNWSP